MGWIKRTVFIGTAFFAILFGVVLYWHNSVFILQGPDHGFLLTKSESVRYSIYLPAFYIHVITGSIVLITGIFQFSKQLRTRYVRFHRSAGKIYIAVILIFTAPSGLLMAFFANGGLVAQSGFALLALLWWIFTWRGWRYAVSKNWNLHRGFLMRSYALTFAAVTLRMYSFLFAFAGLKGELVYNAIVWLSWVPTLLLVEIWLHYSANEKNEIAI